MRSFLATAVCLTLISSTAARVVEPHSYRDLQQRNTLEAERRPVHRKIHNQKNRLMRWFNSFFTQRAADGSTPDTTCYEDGYFEFVQNDLGPSFCQDFMKYPNQTYTVDYTPSR
jgi:hypothetical protein